MSGVFVVATLKFTDVARYRQYQARFGDVFNGSGGTVLAADEAPKLLEGDTVDKVVVMKFDSEAAAEAFLFSPEYQDISKDRIAGATTSSWMVKAY